MLPHYSVACQYSPLMLCSLHVTHYSCYIKITEYLRRFTLTYVYGRKNKESNAYARRGRDASVLSHIPAFPIYIVTGESTYQRNSILAAEFFLFRFRPCKMLSLCKQEAEPQQNLYSSFENHCSANWT